LRPGQDETGAPAEPAPHGEPAVWGVSVLASALRSNVRDEDLVIRVQLPGINPATDIKVTVEDGYLWVRGERKLEEEPKEEALLRAGDDLRLRAVHPAHRGVRRGRDA
jgi:HSP20 family molecular chaperone IbpA